MVPAPNLHCFDPFTSRFIHSKVQRLIRRAGFSESDRADLIQEFVLDLLKRREKFNPAKANWHAFVVVVCQNRYATILEHRHAKKRSRSREAGSLSRPVASDSDESIDLGDTIAEAQHELRTGQQHWPHEEASDVVGDVVGMLDQLPPRLREICEDLKRASVASVARGAGMSQGAFYDLLRRLRTRFEKAGLRDYLK